MTFQGNSEYMLTDWRRTCLWAQFNGFNLSTVFLPTNVNLAISNMLTDETVCIL